MRSIDEIYHDLTSVDIETQRTLWDERGKGYYGEYLVFRELYPKLQGHCKILMNLNIPTENGKTTEIDLLLIHETGLYVFEVKHYKGTIYGKPYEPRWTQYFRTAPNNSFRNPVLQNQYHISALRDRFPEIPVHSYIVFTNRDCELRVEHDDNTLTICKLDELYLLQNTISHKTAIFNIDQIDSVFKELLPFAPIVHHTITVTDQVLPLHQYINKIISDNAQYRQFLDSQQQDALNIQKKKTNLYKILAISFCCICLIISIMSHQAIINNANQQVDSAQAELQLFMQKFEHVGDFNNGNISLSKNLVMATDISLSPSKDLDNTVVFSCSLNWNGDNYGVTISEDTQIIIILKDGTVHEYDLYNERYPYSTDVRLGKGHPAWYSAQAKILPHEFYNMTIKDISYIKLTGLSIWTHMGTHPETVADNYEIELYRASQ